MFVCNQEQSISSPKISVGASKNIQKEFVLWSFTLMTCLIAQLPSGLYNIEHQISLNRRVFCLFRGRLVLDNKEAPTYLLFDHLTKCPNELLGLSFPQWKTARCLSFFDELTRLGLSHWLHCNALDHGWLKTPAPPVGRALPEDPGQAASRESWLSVGLLLDYQGVSGVKSSKLDHCSKKKCVWGNHHNPQCLAMSERRILPITNSGHEEFNFFLGLLHFYDRQLESIYCKCIMLTTRQPGSYCRGWGGS